MWNVKSCDGETKWMYYFIDDDDDDDDDDELLET